MMIHLPQKQVHFKCRNQTEASQVPLWNYFSFHEWMSGHVAKLYTIIFSCSFCFLSELVDENTFHNKMPEKVEGKLYVVKQGVGTRFVLPASTGKMTVAFFPQNALLAYPLEQPMGKRISWWSTLTWNQSALTQNCVPPFSGSLHQSLGSPWSILRNLRKIELKRYGSLLQEKNDGKCGVAPTDRQYLKN